MGQKAFVSKSGAKIRCLWKLCKGNGKNFPGAPSRWSFQPLPREIVRKPLPVWPTVLPAGGIVARRQFCTVTGKFYTPTRMGLIAPAPRFMFVSTTEVEN